MGVPAIENTTAPLLSAERLAQANINPATRLATDYLNHFNEAIMLLEMLSDCPECRDDFLAWMPMSYPEHFAASQFKGRQIAIHAYAVAEPAARQQLEALADSMVAALTAAQKAMRANLLPIVSLQVARSAAQWLRPLVARAGAVINGETLSGTGTTASPQAVVDGLLKP
jgi:hypothetical protein